MKANIPIIGASGVSYTELTVKGIDSQGYVIFVRNNGGGTVIRTWQPLTPFPGVGATWTLNMLATPAGSVTSAGNLSFDSYSDGEVKFTVNGKTYAGALTIDKANVIKIVGIKEVSSLGTVALLAAAGFAVWYFFR